jgi:signal peptidase I
LRPDVLHAVYANERDTGRCTVTEIDRNESEAPVDQGSELYGGDPIPQAETPPDGGKQPKSVLRNIVELVITVAAAIVLALLVQAFLFKPYTIPSGSMEPTLAIGQRIIVNRLDTSPSIGDVTVFHPPALAGKDSGSECGNPHQGPGTASRQACDDSVPASSTQTFVKRVVGLPGDHLRIINGYVWNNGKKETGSYINLTNCATNDECTLPKEITVPKGDYYMMGDNRGNSDDSRYWGPVPQKDIIGVAIITYWPLDRIGFF